MIFSHKNKQNGEITVSRPIKGSVLGFVIGVLVSLLIGQILVGVLLTLITTYLGFYFIDRVDYQNALKAHEAKQKAREEERIQEVKAVERQLKATQRKNRKDKSSLYQNIYTVAGYVLSVEEDLTTYVQNAEDVIAYFKASENERLLAIESFNNALDPNYDVSNFAFNYQTNIGTNRDYINCVLTYAYIISSNDGEMNFNVKDRFIQIAQDLGCSKAALKRLFETKGAEARFAREFSRDNQRSAEDEGETIGIGFDENFKDTHKSKNTNKSHGKDKITESLELLGLDLKASFDEVRKAYKKLMFKYHPDRVASQNLPDDMLTVFQEKTKAIQVAFDILKEQYKDYM